MNAQYDAGTLERLNTEVRGVVNALLGLTDLLLDTQLDSTQREYVDVLRGTADRLLSLGAEAAAITGSSQRAQTFVHMDVRETVAQVGELASALGAGRSITIVTDVASNIGREVLGDRQYIEQALLSVVKACTALDGVRTLRIAVAKPNHEELRYSVQVSCDRQVTDCSAAIQSAERHVQDLSTEYLPDGMTMSFSAAVRPEIRPAESQSSTSVARVLLVEDAVDNQFVVRAFLRNEPFDLEIVSSGAEALDHVRVAQYDTILMDLEMPGMDGMETTAAIREWEKSNRRPATPIVALTARTGSEHVSECLSKGFSGYLSKPVSKSALLAALRAYRTVVQ